MNKELLHAIEYIHFAKDMYGRMELIRQYERNGDFSRADVLSLHGIDRARILLYEIQRSDKLRKTLRPLIVDFIKDLHGKFNKSLNAEASNINRALE